MWEFPSANCICWEKLRLCTLFQLAEFVSIRSRHRCREKPNLKKPLRNQVLAASSARSPR